MAMTEAMQTEALQVLTFDLRGLAQEVVAGVVEGVVGVVQGRFADRLSAHGNAGLVGALGVAGDQGVPVGQSLALVQPAIGAGPGHPLQVLDVPRRQLDAVGHALLAIGVV